jgi:nitroreductase
MIDETLSRAWSARYGSEPPANLPNIGQFLEHRSIREFSTQPVDESTVQALIASAQSASTSSNLQLWSVISVQDPERRQKIADLCDGQDHVLRAPWFFAFLVDHHRLKFAANRSGQDADALEYAEFYTMAVIDAALAAERFVCAAESLGLGVCYIGALRNDPAGVKQLLNLPERVAGIFGLCLGWPSEASHAEIKPRLSQKAIWFRERYDLDPDYEEYNRRMTDFYESQKMKGSVTWSMRSGRRAAPDRLTGRHVLKEWLEAQGFNRR